MSIRVFLLKLSLGLSCLMLIPSCNIYRQIDAKESVLVANQINIRGEETDLINEFFVKGDLQKIPIQKPNKKILGVPVFQHIWAYYNQKKVTKFSQFMKTRVGKPPLIFDSSKVERSRIALENYYFNIGHLDNKVKAKYSTKKKRTVVDYDVYPLTPYRIKNIFHDTLTPVQKAIYAENDQSWIIKGDIFNINNFISEIDRMVFVANDKGYLSFNKDFVRFQYDTFKNTHEIDVYVKILEETDSTQFEQFKLDSIFVFINTSKEQANIYSSKLVNYDNIKFYQPLPNQYHEKFLRKFIYQTHDSFYSKGDINKSIQRFSELGNFKLINSTIRSKSETNKEVDLVYTLTPYARRKFSFGQYVYNSTLGFIGAQPTFTYLNRNLTKKADKLSLSLSGSMEFNAYLNQDKNTSGIVSRTDISFHTNYAIERFLMPFWGRDNYSYLYNRTNINSNYTYSRRINYYDIHNLGLSLSYDWAKKKNTTFSYAPISFNAILFPESSVSDEFKQTLAQNPFLKLTFNNSFIIGSSFTMTHSIALGRKKQNSLNTRLNIEAAGNGVFLIDKFFNFSKDENGVNVNGINVSQFLKAQLEISKSTKISQNRSLHSRIKLGGALPYGNSNNLPYIKQFFIGGPFSIRAFQPRTIGAGLYNAGLYDNDSVSIARDQTGNLSIELNAEYRFHMFSFLKGAFFVDGGNIWNTSINFSQDELGVFKADQFYKQFYIGSGFGLRADFSYFIMRLDFGVPMRVPYLAKNDWVIIDAKPLSSEWRSNNIVINFAVGYPF